MSLISQIKNILGVKVNPATEDTLASIKTKTDPLTFDTGSDPGNLDTNITNAVVFGAKNVSGTRINPATKETLDAVKSQTDQLTFDNRSALVTTGAAPALADAVNVKDTTGANSNDWADEKVILWRKMVKLMESQGTVSKYIDQTGGWFLVPDCQKVIIDGFAGDVVTGVGPSGPGIPLVTLTNDLVENLASIQTAATYVGYNDQQFNNPARIAYARGIRNNLIFN